MGLLDRINNLPANPIAMASLGLLSMPTQTPIGTNPLEYALGGLQQGFQNRALQQEKQARQKQAEQEAMMRKQEYQLNAQKYQQEQYKAAVQRAQEAAQRQYQEQYIASLPPEQQALARVVGVPAYGKETMTQARPEKEPANVQTYRLLNPEDKALSGYDAWNRANKSSGATRVNIGGESKPVLDEASKYVMPDNTAPLPTMTPAEIVAQGGRVLTRAEQAQQDQAAKLKAKQENSGHGVSSAVKGYYDAVKTWRSRRTDANAYAAAEQQRRRMAQMLAQRRNPGRAPTDADVDMALKDIPDPFSVSQGVGAMVGGDPFMARMKVIEQELGMEPEQSQEGGWQTLGNGVRVRVKQ